jgi:topoisomerase-4 subunit A
MDDEIKDDPQLESTEAPEPSENTGDSEDQPLGHSDYKPVNRFDASAVHHLSGMYQNWFLDYASYAILDRAIPHIEDGFKPVQRRIMHTMKRMDDGRYNKVANIVGDTMKFHPHGDASIYDALVQLGQKNLLVDTQGNWGNILTGDRAAAPRYIEARLSKFALDAVFNPKTTEWQLSYDGRNKEPITLPVKYPLLLAQGAEGIAVGLSTKIMPHNFCEICDAAISYLHGEEFHLYPDFQTGGSIDVSKYNDGQRGGSLKVRAKIEKLDQKTLVIRDLPFSKTVDSLIDSIKKAIEKKKINAHHVDDLTSAEVEILVHLSAGVSSDKTIDALYAFTDCEINISPNCCVIKDDKPQFITISDVLRHSTERTKDLIRQELEIRKNELLEQLHFQSLEKIFIEERIYKDRKFEEAPNVDKVCEHIDDRLTPYYPQLIREVTKDDILRLLEIKMQRILKFNKEKADELMARIRAEIEGIDHDLANLVEVTASWFQFLKDKYGSNYPRLTEIKNFDTIEATKVAEANQKLYVNRTEGFIGTGLKKDEFVCNCSDIDDIVIFYRDGKYKVVRVAEKLFVGKNILWLGVFKKSDKRTIYNVVYRDGKNGPCYMKRFNITGITRDRENDLTQGTPGSRVMYFTANPNGEAEVIKITLDASVQAANPRANIFLERSFADIIIKGRASKGNLLTKKPVHRIALKSQGHSTLGGRKVWYDPDVNRLNYDEHGQLLGEFFDDDQILVVLPNGDFYLTSFDANNHYEDNLLRIEKYQQGKVWTAVLFDADNQGYPYLKRFLMEGTKRKQNFVGENAASKLVLLSDQVYPLIHVSYGGKDDFRAPEDIDAEQFVTVKGFKAKGKRLTTYEIESITELEPVRWPEETSDNVESPDASDDSDATVDSETPDHSETLANSEAAAGTETTADSENLDPDAGKSRQQIIDEMTGQLSFDF